jgi:hypothetical protein
MSKIDTLVEVAKTLKCARSLAEKCSDRTLLYFIDMAIFEVCEALTSDPNAEGDTDSPCMDVAHASP